jgi:flagellin
MTSAGVFTPGTGKASVVINLQNAAGANVPVTITAADSTQVTAAEVKAAIDSTSGHKYTATDNSDGTVTIAEYTGVTASADGTMTSAGVFTTTAGKSAATLNLNGTSVGPVDTTGDNDADALAIATAINSGTSTHKYTASHSTDGSGQVTISAGPVNTSVASADQARAAISVIDLGIKAVNTQRSELGAVSNRLSHTVNNLTNISSNLSAAKGGIEDADFAFETTNLAKNQILQQASTAMLAQANASKQNVLSLLQG